MNRFLILALLALPGCSTTGLTPHLTPAGQLAAKKAETSAEIAFGLLEQAYIAAEPYFATHPIEKAEAKGIVAQGNAAIIAARDAETLGDTATIGAKLAAIESLKDQVAALAKGAAK